MTQTAFSFSRLAYGTWRLLAGQQPVNVQDFVRILERCIELGITTIDTAEIYGDYLVEEFLGKALIAAPHLKNKLQWVSKFGIYIPCQFHPDRKVAFYNASAERMIKSTEKSLRFLGLEALDLQLVHRPDWLTSIDETANGINQLVRQGKIKFAGVSNYNVHQFSALNSRLDQLLVTNQVEFSPLHMNPIEDGVFDQCQQLQVRPMAWSPLAGGKLLDSTNAAGIRFQSKAAELSEKYQGAGVDQFAYAWILAHPSQPVPIIGSHQIERIERLVKAANFRLDREDWYALWTAVKGHAIP
jgi:predicted oxidoreductase